jgi:putative transposase
MREVLNALFYITHEGCTWRALPHDFPPWRIVYNYFDAWKRDGTWDRIIGILRVRLRCAAGRLISPRVACIDSQSVKTAGCGQEVGTDGGKKVRGRKSHLVVDTLGLLLAVVVTAANVDDARAAQRLFARMPSKQFYRLEQVQADNKYHSPELDRWLRVHHRGYEVVVVSREPGERRFVPLRSHWLVERTFAWLGRYRRLSKDYEHTPSSSEGVVKLAAIHLYLRRCYPVAAPNSQRFRFVGHRPKQAA